LLLIALILGLFLAWLFFNSKLRSIERRLEITFISPHQALIFWKSDSQSLGYVRSGTSKYWRKTTSYQTSSEAGDIHAVLLEEIPAEGLYISIHNENDNFFYFPEIIKIGYDYAKSEIE
jgi:hypothetical protein